MGLGMELSREGAGPRARAWPDLEAKYSQIKARPNSGIFIHVGIRALYS